jgi:NADH dehydrogenase/NADH:ubiquinone oxidoreductase subunit G
MLSIVGQCRLCLVQLANRQNKMVAGCATKVEEGMDIVTESDALAENGAVRPSLVCLCPTH